jgi:ABC-type transport system substrate-binding protein
MRWIGPLSLAVVSVGCAPPVPAPLPAGPDEAAPCAGGELRMASFAEVRSLDPAVAGDGFSAEVLETLYAGLVDFDARGEVVPEVADHIDTSEDGLVHRVALREGVRFHDGTELTARDVKRSLERALHPTTPSPFASFYASLAGYDAYAEGRAQEIAGITLEGRYQVGFRLARADATFLAALALPAARPVCASMGTRYRAGEAPCGAGPFRLASDGWEPGRGLHVVRHEGYFRPGLPLLDGARWSFNMGVLSQRIHFERGEIDVVRELTQGDATRFLADPRWRALATTGAEMQIFGEAMNVEVAPFDNLEVRRAVAAAIDRAAFERLKPGMVQALGAPVPPSLPLADSTVVAQGFDLAKALEHMRRAGFAFDPITGRGGFPQPIPYVVYRRGLPEYTAQLVQQQLARIGLRLDLRFVSYPAYLALTHRRGRVAMSPQGWTYDIPDPSNAFEGLFSSASIADDDGSNVSFYRSDRLDALLAQARAAREPEVRRHLYGEASRQVVDEAPWAFTHAVRLVELHQPYVRDYRPHPVWARYLLPAWMARAPAAGGAQSVLQRAFGRTVALRGGP